MKQSNELGKSMLNLVGNKNEEIRLMRIFNDIIITYLLRRNVF